MNDLQEKNMEIDLFDVFCLGVDYGQLTMERERENEEWCDAFNGYFVSEKCSMPAQPIRRRQIHSEKWFEAKQKSYFQFLGLMKLTKGRKITVSEV